MIEGLLLMTSLQDGSTVKFINC